MFNNSDKHENRSWLETVKAWLERCLYGDENEEARQAAKSWQRLPGENAINLQPAPITSAVAFRKEAPVAEMARYRIQAMVRPGSLALAYNSVLKTGKVPAKVSLVSSSRFNPYLDTPVTQRMLPAPAIANPVTETPTLPTQTLQPIITPLTISVEQRQAMFAIPPDMPNVGDSEDDEEDTTVKRPVVTRHVERSTVQVPVIERIAYGLFNDYDTGEHEPMLREPVLTEVAVSENFLL